MPAFFLMKMKEARIVAGISLFEELNEPRIDSPPLLRSKTQAPVVLDTTILTNTEENNAVDDSLDGKV